MGELQECSKYHARIFKKCNLSSSPGFYMVNKYKFRYSEKILYVEFGPCHFTQVPSLSLQCIPEGHSTTMVCFISS